MLGALDRFAHAGVGRRVSEVPLDVRKACGEAVEHRPESSSSPAPTIDSRARSTSCSPDPVVDRDADDRAVDETALLQPVERAERHHLGEIAGDPEDRQHVRALRTGLSGGLAIPPSAPQGSDGPYSPDISNLLLKRPRKMKRHPSLPKPAWPPPRHHSVTRDAGEAAAGSRRVSAFASPSRLVRVRRRRSDPSDPGCRAVPCGRSPTGRAGSTTRWSPMGSRPSIVRRKRSGVPVDQA